MPPVAEAPITDKPSPRSQTIAQALDETYERLPIEQIVPSKTNPRRHFDAAYLHELATSIRERGVHTPVVVRPLDVLQAVLNHPDRAAKNGARYELVAGECRYRASLEAQQTHLPAVIRRLTNEQALEIQLEENIHRQDLTPLEEGRGYRALIASNPDKHSAATIATRIGKSPAYVWDRLKLLDLVPEAKQLLETERISAGHAILIARLKPADQARVIKPGMRNGYGGGGREGLWQYHGGQLEFATEQEEREHERRTKDDPYRDLKPVSVRELESWIRDHIRFDVAHAAKAQPLTFEATLTRVSDATAQPGRGKKVIAITHEYRVADDARDEAERTYGSQSWVRADGLEKSKTCEHAVLGVVVAGRGQGDTLQVCVARDKCRVHFGKVIAAKEKAAKLRESGKGKLAAKVEKRQQNSWEEENRKREEERKRWTGLKPHAIAAVVATLKDKPLTDSVLKAVIVELVGYNGTVKQVEQLLGKPITAKTFVRTLAIVEVLEHDNTRDSFKAIAKKHGVDLAKLEKEHAAASPAKAKKGAAA